MKIGCCCCGRQIIKDGGSDHYVAPGPVTLIGPGEFCCSECADDLDENGLFTEEGMNNEEFKALLSLLMETDGTGFSDNDRQTLLDYANRKSRELGYYDWIGAYHGL